MLKLKGTLWNSSKLNTLAKTLGGNSAAAAAGATGASAKNSSRKGHNNHTSMSNNAPVSGNSEYAINETDISAKKGQPNNESNGNIDTITSKI